MAALAAAALLLGPAAAPPPATYTAAFAELRAQSAPTGPATLALNVERSAAVAAEAAGRGADILVLPEYGLSGFGSGRDAWLPYLEQLPPPPPLGAEGAVPCDAPPEQYRLAPSLVGLSCAARAHAIALVANLGDLIYCDATPAYPGCAESRDGRLQFNTAVAFDSDGRYLARAHKQNLWGEAGYFDEPVDCALSSFATSFVSPTGPTTHTALPCPLARPCSDRAGCCGRQGVEFGLFTCADLIYDFPATALLDRGLVNFVAPMAWSDEMAQMQALPSYQAWSLSHCVNLVATNHRGPRMSGSAALSCGSVLAATFAPGNVDGPLHLATLPIQPTAGPTPAPAAAEATAVMAAVAAAREATARRRGATAEPWAFARLDSSGEWQTLCSDSGDVCCTVTTLVGAGTGVGSGYVLAALDGDDRGGGIRWSGAACGVLACAEPGPGCLDYQPPPAAEEERLAGVVMTMTTHPPIGANISVFPMALAAGSDASEANGRSKHGGREPRRKDQPQQEGQQRLLEPFGPSGELEYTVLDGAPGFGFWRLQAASLPAGQSGPLVSALLYGRVFARDELGYDCPAAERPR